jgi:energy-coupling factor transporter ATP-binding protein EcfA2
MNQVSSSSEPLLRTLAPALRQLQIKLRAWLDAPHRFPLSTIAQATLQGLDTDLKRQAEALDVDRPLLVIMLMGGTGVGKSTLLNALAGGDIAQASITRPTTRDPVVYYHEAIKADRLDPALRQCRLMPHDRPALEHKVIVDTPDLDSNDLANREKLMQILPAADVVLYVGSQEKYHDKLGWNLFLQQRRRRAFAFVLNKWDRCQNTGPSGLRPDDDLLQDLKAEGFTNPLLFRTCAQYWAEDRRSKMEDRGKRNEDGESRIEDGESRIEDRGSSVEGRVELPSATLDPQSSNFHPRSSIHDPPSSILDLPEGEQFPELARWLEMGLTRLEIEAIKARGVSQLLEQLQQTLEKSVPPDLTEVAERTKAVWEKLLADESRSSADVLLNTLEPYQREIEHHFARESQRRFRGLMATYLHAVTRVKFVGSTLRDHLTLLPRPNQAAETPAAWSLAAFTTACSNVAGEQHLDARVKAMTNRLLVEADKLGFPLEVLTEPAESAARLEWRQRYARALIEVLSQVERQWARPTGPRRWLQAGLVFLSDWLPSVTLLGACIWLLYQYFMQGRSFALGDLLLPLIAVLAVMVLLHIGIALVMPMRWPAMRGEFLRHLERRLQTELQSVYAPIPGDAALVLRQERRAVEQLAAQTREVATWLQHREQDAGIEGLYGNQGNQ